MARWLTQCLDANGKHRSRLTQRVAIQLPGGYIEVDKDKLLANLLVHTILRRCSHIGKGTRSSVTICAVPKYLVFGAMFLEPCSGPTMIIAGYVCATWPPAGSYCPHAVCRLPIMPDMSRDETRYVRAWPDCGDRWVRAN